MKKLLNTIFSLSVIIILLLGLALPVNPPVGNWYQQFMPNIGGRTITDVFFLDSLTGWSVTNATNQGTDTIFVLKTTNSGDNWAIQYTRIQTGGGFSGYFKVYFLNQNTGYTSDVLGVYKTTNGGSNWASMNAPLNAYLDMSILSTDTIWIVSGNPLTGGVFFTSNGGASWQNQLNLGSQNPDHIYMINGRIGFISEVNGGAPYTRKTTNSGVNWTVLTSGSGEAFFDMYFADSLTGWGQFYNLRKTTNGGINWIIQTLPTGGNILISQIDMFSGMNKDTIWGVGGSINANGFRGIIYRTTNGGGNWFFQVPDTAIHIGRYSFVSFVNIRNGWAYSTVPAGVHTTIGGDPVWYTGIQQISNNIPKDFELHQNYPNPFNPRTVIPFSLKRSAYVRLIAYDITGREIQKMVEGNYSAGEYEVDFMGKFTASGVYLYRMEAEEPGGNKFVDTKKMILIK